MHEDLHGRKLLIAGMQMFVKSSQLRQSTITLRTKWAFGLMENYQPAAAPNESATLTKHYENRYRFQRTRTIDACATGLL